jgi:hypothetical protein
MNKQGKPVLKPCPCCGGEAFLRTVKKGRSVLHTGYWEGYVYCSTCNLQTGFSKNPNRCEREWNKRTSTPEQVAYLESLRPEWAKGYTSDGVAASVMQGALNQVYDAFGTKNLTDTMDIIRRMKAGGKL